MTNKSLLVLSLLFFVLSARDSVASPVVNNLKGSVTNFDLKGNQRMSNNIANSCSDLATNTAVVEEAPPKLTVAAGRVSTIQPIESSQTSERPHFVQTSVKIQPVQQAQTIQAVEPVRTLYVEKTPLRRDGDRLADPVLTAQIKVQPSCTAQPIVDKTTIIKPSVEKAVCTQPAYVDKTARKSIDVVEPVKLVSQIVPSVENKRIDKTQHTLQVEKPMIYQTTKQIQSTQCISTVQPTQSIQPVKTFQTVQPILQVEQPIIFTRTQQSSKPSLIAQSKVQQFPSIIAQAKQVAAEKPGVIDFTRPLTNTVLGKNNVVSGIQNKVSASNSQVIGHGNIVVDNCGGGLLF